MTLNIETQNRQVSAITNIDMMPSMKNYLTLTKKFEDTSVL